MSFFLGGSQKTDEQMHKETDKFMFHPLATAGLSAELESYSSDRAVLLKGRGNAKGSSLGGTIVTMLNAYMGSGILVIPYAWKQAGWLYVLPFLAVTMMMSFTLWLMGSLVGKRRDVWKWMGNELKHNNS
jgi:VIT1/CCC1 family predicted Fe2+/Mn2+ transporter